MSRKKLYRTRNLHTFLLLLLSFMMTKTNRNCCLDRILPLDPYARIQPQQNQQQMTVSSILLWLHFLVLHALYSHQLRNTVPQLFAIEHKIID